MKAALEFIITVVMLTMVFATVIIIGWAVVEWINGPIQAS